MNPLSEIKKGTFAYTQVRIQYKRNEKHPDPYMQAFDLLHGGKNPARGLRKPAKKHKPFKKT